MSTGNINLGEVIPMKRKKELQVKKRAGWWVEFHEGSEEYRIMRDRNSYSVIRKEEHDYFRSCNSYAYLPEIAKLNSNQYDAMTRAWSEHYLLKSNIKYLEQTISNTYNRSGEGPFLDLEMLIDSCTVLNMARKRLLLIQPRQGKTGTWKTFLKL